MNRQQRRDWIEIIGVAAVIITLGFVALEVRQNTNAVRSAVVLGVTEQSIDVYELLIQDDSLREAMRAVDAGTARPEQQDRINLLFSSITRLQQNRFLQIELGVVDKDTLLLLGGRGDVFRREGYRAYWAQRRNEHSPEFRAYMEEVVMPGASRDAEEPD